MSNDDVVITMNTDIQLTDVNGNPITVETQQPEFFTESFSLGGVTRGENQSSKIPMGEK